MTDLIFCYITCANSDEAARIGKELLTSRLSACVNIFNGMKSMYWWNDEIQTDNEAVLVAKTQKENFEELKTLVEQHHSYDCPCIVALPIENANQAYVDWLIEETSHAKAL
jgi:periplasmic divalent cation tolerance protein